MKTVNKFQRKEMNDNVFPACGFLLIFKGCLILVSLFWSSFAIAEPEVEKMTLTQVVAQVLKNNHDISVQGLNQVIQEELIKVEKAVFDPRLEASYAYQYIDTPQNAQEFVATGGGAATIPTANTQTGLATPILGRPTIFEQRNHVSDVALIQRLTNGAVLDLGTSQRVLDNTLNRNLPPGIFNPEFETFTGLTVTQPLLRDAGREVNLTKLRIAQSNTRIANLELHSRTAAMVANAMKLYYDVIFTYENMLVQRDAIELASQLLVENRKRSEEGVLSPIEVLVAEGAVFSRREDALIAKSQYVDRQNALQLLFRTASDTQREVRIVPASKLLNDFSLPGRDHLIAKAQSSRYDILQTLEMVDQRKRQSQFAKNQIKPRLDFVASAGVHGLDGSYGRSFSSAADGQGPEWTVGFKFSIPIGAKSARAEAEMARLQIEQARIETDKVKAKVALELDTVLSRVETDRQRLATGRKGRQVAGEAMEGEIKRLGEGVSTTYQVLQYQNEYSQTRSRELAALADLNKNQIDLWLVTGLLLEKRGIEFDEVKDPEQETKRKWRLE